MFDLFGIRGAVAGEGFDGAIDAEDFVHRFVE